MCNRRPVSFTCRRSAPTASRSWTTWVVLRDHTPPHTSHPHSPGEGAVPIRSSARGCVKHIDYWLIECGVCTLIIHFLFFLFVLSEPRSGGADVWVGFSSLNFSFFHFLWIFLPSFTSGLDFWTRIRFRRLMGNFRLHRRHISSWKSLL